jgi:uncharacterized membrane protein YgcG
MMKVLTSLLVAATVNAWTVDKMHRPQGRVADPDGLLKNPDAIEDALARLATKHVEWPPNSPCATTNVDGVEAVVVVVTHLRGVHLKQEDDEKRRRAGEFARGLHDKWGVGSKACSNGVLIAISYGDRAFYLSTGEGLRSGGLLSDARATRALEASAPYLRSGDIDQGIMKTIKKVDAFLARGPPTWSEWLASNETIRILFFLFIYVYCFAMDNLRRCLYNCLCCLCCDWEFVLPWRDRRRREYEAATRQLRAVEKFRDATEGETSAAESCPVCLEAFTTTPKALGCGHVFCAPCLSQWTRENSTCPICRAPVSGSDYGTSTTPLSYTPTQRRDDEVVYRLRRIHRMYPSAFERTRSDELFDGGYRSGSLARYARAPPPPPPPRASYSSSRSRGSGGYSSSSSTYGGGRSSGGGGGGGW